jgi:hypothetical protein
MPHSSIALSKPVESRIIVLRGHKVILDSDLAELYGVAVRHLNQQVKRNAKRFPRDFFFQLSEKEFNGLRSQFVISNSRVAADATCLMPSPNTARSWRQQC